MQGSSKRCLPVRLPVESDITLPPVAGVKNGGRDRFLQINGTILHDGNNTTIGALLVASDVTRLRQLENVRKEFVANVSHELRTPLTTIKGFVETLESGALENREEAAQIPRHHYRTGEPAKRDHSKTFSCLRSSSVKRRPGTLVFSRRSVLETAQAAVRNYERAAQLKNIAMNVSGDAGCSAKVNQPLLEQAIGNLIDNAIKYSEPQRAVEIDVSRAGMKSLLRSKTRG